MGNYTGIAPCKGCTSRRTGCHSICSRYKKWKQEENEYIQKMDFQRSVESNLNDHMFITIRMCKKKRDGR